MKFSSKQLSFIDGHLGNNTSSIIEARDSSLFSILLWNPLKDEANLKCPDHGRDLQDTGIWTHMRGMENRRPRLLYHLGENVLLISAIYRCPECGNEFDKDTYMAHHPELLTQLFGRHLAPFLLFSKAGMTRQACEMVVNATLAGTSFAEITTSFDRLHGCHMSIYGKPEEEEVNMKHSSPSYKLCEDVFMADFESRLPFYEEQMGKFKASEIGMDHTFNTRFVTKFSIHRIFTNDFFFQSIDCSEQKEALFCSIHCN